MLFAVCQVYSHTVVREKHTHIHRESERKRERERKWEIEWERERMRECLENITPILWLYWPWRKRGVGVGGHQTRCIEFKLWHKHVWARYKVSVTLSMQDDRDGVIFRHFNVCLSKNPMTPYWVSFRWKWPVEGSVEGRSVVLWVCCFLRVCSPALPCKTL